MTRKFGWKPDRKDFRDYYYTTTKKVRNLPQFVDLRLFCPPIVDQGELGSCTANALTGAFDYLQLQGLRKTEVYPEEYGKKFSASSRLFIYYNEREMEGTVNSDDGAEIRDGIKVLNEFGCAPEKIWPYKISKFTSKPLPTIYSEAAKHKTVTYYRINSLNEMKACIAEGFPFVFGFFVFESFDSIGSDGIMLMPKKGEPVLGGHAVLAVGYDSKKKHFIVRNSYSSQWGDKGHFYIPFRFMQNTEYVDDLWTIRK